MNILPMKYYLAVVKYGGISAAAKELFITQQTLSTHIAAMEKELGCILFERKPVFRLTDSGTSFCRYCENMVALDEQMHREFAERKKEPAGTLRVGISQTRSRIMMPAVAKEWRKRYPKVCLEIHEMTNEQLIRAIMDGKLEVAVGNIHDEIPELQVESLHQENVMLLVPDREEYCELKQMQDMDRMWQLLGRYTFIMHTDRDIIGRYSKSVFEEHGLIPEIAVVSDNAETCMDMCRNGMGLYICPDFLLENLKASNQCLAIPLHMEYTISAAYRKQAYQSRLVEEFVQTLKRWEKEKT